jgi:hypothetical protein
MIALFDDSTIMVGTTDCLYVVSNYPVFIDIEAIEAMLFRSYLLYDIQLHRTFMEHRYRLIISLLVATYSGRYWRRQPPSKSGFLGVAGKRKKGKA